MGLGLSVLVLHSQALLFIAYCHAQAQPKPYLNSAGLSLALFFISPTIDQLSAVYCLPKNAVVSYYIAILVISH